MLGGLILGSHLFERVITGRSRVSLGHADGCSVAIWEANRDGTGGALSGGAERIMSSRVPRLNPMAKRQDATDKVFTVSASERGQVMLLVCVGIFALMGMIAVVADFGFLQHQRNMMQTAADSAAMAGSEELNYGDQVAAGKADAASNGYTDGLSSVTVAINNPPSTGPNTANAAYVEATISKPEPTYFLSVIGINTMT